MCTGIEDIIKKLREALNEDQSTFETVAPLGERLRRALIASEEPDITATDLLADYDERLTEAGFVDFHVGGGKSFVAAKVEQLVEYAGRDFESRAMAEGKQIMVAIDDFMLCAIAATRAGVLPERELQRLAGRIKEKVRELAPRLVELWQCSEDSLLELGSDPWYPQVPDWRESLAELAPSRIGLIAATIRELQRRGSTSQTDDGAYALAAKDKGETVLLERNEFSLVHTGDRLIVDYAHDHELPSQQPTLEVEGHEPLVGRRENPGSFCFHLSELHIREAPCVLKVPISGSDIVEIPLPKETDHGRD